MKLNAFTCRDGFLLSAECMLLPNAATKAFWPVSAVIGILDCRELPPALCARIADDVELQQFAFVELHEALQANLPGLAMRTPYAAANALHPKL